MDTVPPNPGLLRPDPDPLPPDPDPLRPDPSPLPPDPGPSDPPVSQYFSHSPLHAFLQQVMPTM